MEQYRTEEEQLDALRRWWNDNGRSTIAAVILALGVGFGWQGYKQYDQQQREGASEVYQRMLQALAAADPGTAPQQSGQELAEQLKTDFSGSTYAQFAALHLARIAVERGDLQEAEAQLRWVLGQADSGGDTALIAQLRLARVMAASGDADQALKILEQVEEGPYQASYALARGDILLSMGQQDEARHAYGTARMLAEGDGAASQVNLVVLEQKLQALNPIPPRPLEGAAAVDAGAGQPAAADAGAGQPAAADAGAGQAAATQIAPPGALQED